jgi:hypothetical protein
MSHATINGLGKILVAGRSHLYAWSKRYNLVFFIGFLVFTAAIAYVRLTNVLLSANALLVAVRFLGLGLMFSGLALWIALLRADAGKTGVNTIIGLMVVAGLALLAVFVLLPSTLWTQLFGWGGAALTISALIIGVVAMIVSPAYPRPLTTRWPEGGETTDNPHSTPQSH